MCVFPVYELVQLAKLYKVVQNKPDYLLLLPKLCISTTKHVSLIMYV